MRKPQLKVKTESKKKLRIEVVYDFFLHASGNILLNYSDA